MTGFFEHNSVVLHIGDELVTFGGASQQAPWRFTGVKRGALGTKAAAHEQGAKARHLKECFGLFVPDPESSLFEEIAANHAEVVNRCGFDGIYLDAIDGSSILRGNEELLVLAGQVRRGNPEAPQAAGRDGDERDVAPLLAIPHPLAGVGLPAARPRAVR